MTRAVILSRAGAVILHDLDTNTDMLVMTATQAVWLSFFVQQNLGSETAIQLRLAAKDAEQYHYTNSPEPGMAKQFQLQRN